MLYLKYFESFKKDINVDLNDYVCNNDLNELKELYENGADLNRIDLTSLIHALKFSYTEMSDFLLKNCDKFKELNMNDVMLHVNKIPDSVLTNDCGECNVCFAFDYDPEEVANELGFECLVTDDLVDEDELEDNIQAIFYNSEYMGNDLYIYCFFKRNEDMLNFMKRSKEISPLNKFVNLNNSENYSDVDIEFIKDKFKFSCIFNTIND